MQKLDQDITGHPHRDSWPRWSNWPSAEAGCSHSGLELETWDLIMSTFADLGIPFPLFEAPTTEASDYAGIATCRLCGGRDRHGFEVDHLILPCPACGVEVGLAAAGRTAAPCRSCGGSVPFPEPLKAKMQILVCYDCLRAGRGAITKSTEFGTVTWQQAFEGVTLGVPGLQTDQFPLVPIDPDDDW